MEFRIVGRLSIPILQLGVAASIDAAPLPPRPVSVVSPSAVPACLDARDIPSHAAFSALVSGTGAFLAVPEASNSLILKVDSLSGRCRLSAQLVEGEQLFEGQRLAPQGQNASDTARWSAVLSDLAATWFSRRSGSVELSSRPAGVGVFIGGRPAGSTPLRLEHLEPGRFEVVLRSPGWEEVRDTLVVEAGAVAHREHELRRTRAWLDSVHRAEVSRRRDSIWAQARISPAQALPDLFARLANVPLPAGRQPLAVLPFAASPRTVRAYDPGVMAAEYGVAHFSRDPRYQVVERAGINDVLREQALSLSGASDDSAATAGRLVAARYLVTGTVSIDGSRQTFAARMVSVETGEVVSAAVAVLGQDRLEELYRTAIGERGQLSGSLYRSAAGPGWGQFYTNHPVHGGVALGVFAASVGWSVLCWADYSDKDSELRRFRNHDPSLANLGDQWIPRANKALKDRNDASSRFGWSLGLVGLAWTGNLLDAGILGFLESRRIHSEYFSWVPTAVQAGPDAMRITWGF